MTSHRPLSLVVLLMASLGCGSPEPEEPEAEASTGTETSEMEAQPEAAPPGEAIAEPVEVEETVSEEPVEAAVVVPPAAEESPVYTGPQARLCGCGCCGEPSHIECVATEAELRRREREDRRGVTPFACRAAGCSAGTLLRVCTPTP